MNHKHYSGLDTLRGIAALMVAAGHAYIAVMFGSADQIWARTIWTIHSLDAQLAKLILFFANGAAAVTLFFILSGAVLGISLDADDNAPIKRYSTFLIKRIFRIYPAHIFVLCCICFLLWMGMTNPGTFDLASTWYNWFYRSAPGFSTTWRNALLLESSLNAVTWTLVVEMAAAFVFPALYYFSRLRYRPVPVQDLMLLFLLALSCLWPNNILPAHLYKFHVGLLIPLYGPHIAKRLKEITGLSSSQSLFAGILILLAERQLSNGGYMGYGIASAMGAVIVTYQFMYNGHNIAPLRNTLLRNLGKYSYSFYLWHFPILWFLYYGIHINPALERLLVQHALLMASLVCFISIALAYIFSAFSYRMIEVAFITLGKNLVNREKAGRPLPAS